MAGFELKAIEATEDQLRKKGGREPNEQYVPFLQAFLKGSKNQIEVVGIPITKSEDPEGKNLQKILVALKTTRTRHEMPLKVITRLGEDSNPHLYLVKQQEEVAKK